jgi:hypothetical protein
MRKIKSSKMFSSEVQGFRSSEVQRFRSSGAQNSELLNNRTSEHLNKTLIAFKLVQKFSGSGVQLNNQTSEHLNKLFIGILLILCSILNAQENRTSIKLIVRPLSDSILLRWAPDNFEGWNAGNKYGYKIVRYTLMRNGQMLNPEPNPEHLNSKPLNPELPSSEPVFVKPWPLNQWEQLADKDDYAGVAAQAIYGKTFELSSNKSTYSYDVVSKVKEQDSRYSFALFAADLSPATARASGLWFTDRNVKKGEKYLYRVMLAVPDNVIKADTGFAFTGVDEYMPLPKPINLGAEFGDKSVLLHWDRKTLSYLYNSYSIERSEDGINFIKVKKQPIVYANSGDFVESDEMMFVDSLSVNDKPYTYRVKGYTAFGETSPPSEIAKGQGTIEIKSIPDITGHKEINGQIDLKWKFPEAENTSIAGFKVLRSGDYNTFYDTISPMLKPETRGFLDPKPLSTNYYKVLVQGKSGTKKKSLEKLIQLTDSIPPDPPTGLHATADTSGKLILTWKANREKDMEGYRIYRANSKDDEFSQITVEPVKDTMYIDHINVKTITKKIYYQLMAIDKRLNHSGFSAPLEVERPDVVPPAPPAISKIKSTPQGVFIAWENSTSVDVAKHLLYRKADGQDTIKMINEFAITDTTKSYIDSTGMANTVYYYTLVAQDNSGLKSVPTSEMAGQKIASLQINEIGEVRCKRDRKAMTITLSWNQPKCKVKRYTIYRKAGEEVTLSAYATISGDKPEFTDKRVKTDTKYSYAIKPVIDNSITTMSSTVEIDF